MKKTLLPLLGLVLTGTFYAQADDKPAPKKSSVPQLSLRWGSDTTQSRAMNAAAFRQLMKEKVQIVDDSANRWKIQGFDFQYAERGVYEDSAGNPLMLVEYLTEFCPGDSVSSGIRTLLPDRVKPEDTAFISRIQIADAKGNVASAKGFRVVIVK